MVDHPELTDELIDAHLSLAYKSSGLNAMTGEKWDRVVAHRFFALGALFGAGMINLEAPAADGVPAAPKGYKLVPLELTPDMEKADPYGMGYGRLQAIWSRLLAAAPDAGVAEDQHG